LKKSKKSIRHEGRWNSHGETGKAERLSLRGGKERSRGKERGESGEQRLKDIQVGSPFDFVKRGLEAEKD